MNLYVTSGQILLSYLYLIHAITLWDCTSNSYDNNGQRRSENLELYGASILENDRWGDPEVEGRILCEKYGVKLHVVERQIEKKGVFFDQASKFLSTRGHEIDSNALRKKCLDFVANNQLPEWFVKTIGDEHGFSLDEYKNHLAGDIHGRGENENTVYGKNNIESKILAVIYKLDNFRVKEFQDNVVHLNSIVDSSGSRTVDMIDYNSDSVLHIANKGNAHFEPLLDKNKSLTKQPQKQTQGQDDRKLAEKLQQEENDHGLAITLQKEEYNSLMRDNIKNTFKKDAQCYADKLLATILQREEIGEVNRLVKSIIRGAPKQGKCSSFADSENSRRNQTLTQPPLIRV